MPKLDSLEISFSDTSSTAVVIWMHGLGADGQDFVPIVEELGLPGIRFIFPHAPYLPITMNGGYEMRAWYDIHGLEPGSRQDEAGIRSMQNHINELIEDQVQLGIPSERIVLAGFSQGGAMALHTALRHPWPLAGILALSSYLPLPSQLAIEANRNNKDLPIFMAHGDSDNVINLQTAQLSAALLTQQGYAVDWHEYAMAHSVCNQEIDDIRHFLMKTLINF